MNFHPHARLGILALAFALASPALAQETFLYLDSDPGDFIGGGQMLWVTPDDGDFSINRNFDNGISVTFLGGGSDFWFLDFAAPFEAELTPGAYEGATRFPFQAADEPGLSVSGQGRGCNMLTGRFVVLDVEYGSGGEVLRFAANFEQHCEGGDPALYGAIRWESSVAATPAVSLLANATTFATGDTLEARLILDNLREDRLVDLYFGAVLPDGDRVIYFTSFALDRARGRLSEASTLRPIRRNVSLATPFTFERTPVIEHLFLGNEPAGTWELWFAAVEPGGFDDGVIHPEDIVAESLVPFTFTP